ncbi:hypothetical protein AM592_06945 [Bacillus gobiensis]|uniref:Uncharacterized protein n=2 Tax=Bacillus TaxID=1386 RepID=A0A0M4FFZ9_9BACI|nr:hypothetical protein AM592_06945 [Bacillus gobiensis]
MISIKFSRSFGNTNGILTKGGEKMGRTKPANKNAMQNNNEKKKNLENSGSYAEREVAKLSSSNK